MNRPGGPTVNASRAYTDPAQGTYAMPEIRVTTSVTVGPWEQQVPRGPEPHTHVPLCAALPVHEL